MVIQAAIESIRARRRPLRDSEPDSASEASEEVEVLGEEGSLLDRRLSQEEWEERVGRLHERGLPVRLFLDPPPDDESLYEPSVPPEWVSEGRGEGEGYWLTREPELLRIKTRPRRDFTHLRNRGRREGEVYHIPLCFTNELHRFDLRDRSAGVRRGLAAYEELRRRYHGRTAVLRGRVAGTALEIGRRSEVEGSGYNIQSDRDVWALHDAGSFHDRPLFLGL
jgi:hypothetical protein